MSGHDHLIGVFLADFRYLAKFIADHPGDEVSIERLIAEMAVYRAESYMDLMLECYEAGASAGGA